MHLFVNYKTNHGPIVGQLIRMLLFVVLRRMLRCRCIDQLYTLLGNF